MRPGERWTHHVANILVGGTGVIYAVMRYALQPEDPYAVVNHPWQPALQHLHILTAPILVFAIGLSWQSHIAPRLGRRTMPRYRTGIELFLTSAPMVASGYLLQTAVEPSWRKAWIVVHLVASGLWMLGYVLHQLMPQKSSGRRRTE